METYSLDLRKRIVDAIERGVGTRSEVAKLFGVHETFVYKLLRQKRECGDIAPPPASHSVVPVRLTLHSLRRTITVVLDLPFSNCQILSFYNQLIAF
jgi:transposase